MGWGQRGTLSVATILEQINRPAGGPGPGDGELEKSEAGAEALGGPQAGPESWAAESLSKEERQTAVTAGRTKTETEAQVGDEAGAESRRDSDVPAATTAPDATGTQRGAQAHAGAELTLEDYEAALDADDALLGAIDM